MKPLNYLRPQGKEIFKQILNAIPRDVSKDIDTYELSMLANAFDLHERVSAGMNKDITAYCTITKSGYSQISAEFSVWHKGGGGHAHDRQTMGQPQNRK